MFTMRLTVKPAFRSFSHMREAITQAEVEQLSGAAPKDIVNWIERLKFATKLANTSQGIARQFSRDNTVEISLIARLVRAGIPPALASERVQLLFEQWEHELPLRWVLFVCGDKPSAIDVVCLDEPPNAKALDALDEQESVYVLINTARLVDRVDAYFDGDGE
jgi:hypothetical protein